MADASPPSMKRRMTWNSAGILSYMALQWLITILVVRLGGFEDAGNLALAMSFTTVFQSLAFFCVRNFQASDVRNEFQSGDYIFLRILTCAAGMALCAVAALLGRYTVSQTVCILLFMGYRLTEASVDVLHGIDQKAWRLDIIGQSYLLRGLAAFVGFCGALWLTGSLNLAIACMTGAALLVVALFDVPHTRALASLRPVESFPTAFRLARQALPILICAQLTNLLQVMPRFLLEKTAGPEMLGYYATIATPTVLLSVLANIAFAPLITLLAEAYQQGDARKFWRATRLFVGGALALGGLALLAARFLGDWALSLLFGAGILPYSYMLAPILCNVVLLVLTQLLLSLYTATRRLRVFTVTSGVAAAVTLAAALLLIPRSPLPGTNLATILGYLTQLLLAGGYLAWKRRDIFPGKDEVP